MCIIIVVFTLYYRNRGQREEQGKMSEAKCSGFKLRRGGGCVDETMLDRRPGRPTWFHDAQSSHTEIKQVSYIKDFWLDFSFTFIYNIFVFQYWRFTGSALFSCGETQTHYYIYISPLWPVQTFSFYLSRVKYVIQKFPAQYTQNR